jgi:hypothetical protein
VELFVKPRDAAALVSARLFPSCSSGNGAVTEPKIKLLKINMRKMKTTEYLDFNESPGMLPPSLSGA